MRSQSGRHFCIGRVALRGPVAFITTGLVWVLLLAGAGAAAALNPIQVENALPGTTGWQIQGGESTAIQGYASQASVQPGDTLALHVSTISSASYRVEIYRLGWYGGAGGRLVACIPSCTAGEPGSQRPVGAPDPATGRLDAGWPVTDAITVGSGWTSGYYVGKLVLTSGSHAGGAAYIPFVTRSTTVTKSAILVQASVNTWQAYNPWGGKSLYTFNSTPTVVPSSGTAAASQISFNRPLQSTVLLGPIRWEYPLVRFLERVGYDVSYQTDVDTDQNPGTLLGHRLDIASGHDEYWSKVMRDAWEAARNAGTNLAFIGGNMAYWQARYANAGRTLIEYRSAALDPNPAPALKTVQFRQLNPARPECTLLGVGYAGGLRKPGDPDRSFTVTSAASLNPWFQGSGLVTGSTISAAVGYEWDTVQAGCAVPPLHVLLHYSGSPSNADAVTYTAGSGARVFSDGTLDLVWALDDYGQGPHVDIRTQRLFANIFDDLGGAPAPNGPVATLFPLRESSPPSAFTLHAPNSGAVVWTFRPRMSWTASSDPSGLAPYGVFLDGSRVGSTRATALTVSRDLSEGRHVWNVTATDLAGNQYSTARQTFRVASVRVMRHSRAYVLAHGFTLGVYCLARCSSQLSITVRGAKVALHVRRTNRHAGVHTIRVPLSTAFRRFLQHRRTASLRIAVRNRSAHSNRTVKLTLRW